MFQGLATGPEFKVQSTNHVESKAHSSRRFIQASHRGGSKLRFGMIDRGYRGAEREIRLFWILATIMPARDTEWIGRNTRVLFANN